MVLPISIAMHAIGLFVHLFASIASSEILVRLAIIAQKGANTAYSRAPYHVSDALMAATTASRS